MNIKRAILDSALGYNVFDMVVGKLGYSRAKLFAKYCPYTPGMRVLDLGCGPGTATKFFQAEVYLGIDTSVQYIEAAKRDYPLHQFDCCDFGSSYQVVRREHGRFDLVIAMGLLHHLDDRTAREYIAYCRKIINPGGILVTFDGCLYLGQSKIRRRVVLSDRGKFIRTEEGYLDLFKNQGFKALGKIEEDILLIPHSMLAITARVDRSDADLNTGDVY